MSVIKSACRVKVFRKFVSSFVVLSFLFTFLIPANSVLAQGVALPTPGTLVPPSTSFEPIIIKGIRIHPENPLKFNFIVDPGDTQANEARLREEGLKLIKYFFATLTIPENDLWVNLSPYEKNRIIPEGFGQTEMGRDLLAQDYLLKQLTASLVHPETDLGKKFWNRVYARAQELYGTSEIPMNTFNKVWIIPENATVYVHGTNAFVVRNHLKVMLEEDYLALQQNKLTTSKAQAVSGVSSKIIKDIVIPEIEKEINEGENFANLRQIYNSMILATWYKKELHDGLLAKVYMDQNKVRGVDIQDKDAKQKIYNQYVEAFKKGVYNYIKEEVDPKSQQVVPRKYFSGGALGTTREGLAVTRDPAVGQ
ncbi:MAG: hypothetical protein NUV91_04465, partial [Candidatus Omnitrophica bacterium]|nr:hypothetical protein [Candidatus Omnitrophota bacterium]